MNNWLWAVLAIVVSMTVASVLARLVRSQMGKETRPEPMQQNAAAIGSIVFSGILVIGLIAALGFVKPESLDKITDDAVAYLPRALSAGIVLIVGNILATIASTAVLRMVAQAGPAVAKAIPNVVKWGIFGFTVILAASQLGIDTTTINIAVAAMLFSLGFAMTMLVGLGGQTVSREIAAGRAMRRVLEPGDQIQGGSLSGTVITVHSTSTEIADGSGETMLYPNSTLLGSTLSVLRPDRPEDDEDAS